MIENEAENRALGDKAEINLLEMLYKKGHTILRPDWIGIHNGEVVVYEVKAKREPFKPAGSNDRQ